MADDNEEGFGSQRKMSVADTLAQATKALRTHRTWMQKRISAVTPIVEQDGEIEGEDAGSGKEHASERSRTVDAEKLKKWQEAQRKPERGNAIAGQGAPLHVPAPPLLAMTVEGIGPGGYAAGQEWIEFLKQKRKLAKVTPVASSPPPPRTLASVAEEVEGSPKIKRRADQSRTAWGSTDDLSGSPLSRRREPLKPANFRQVVAGSESREGERREGDSQSSGPTASSDRAATKLKRRKVSKGSVAPVTVAPIHPPTAVNRNGGGILPESVLATGNSSEIFVRPQPNISSPPGLGAVSAWGKPLSLGQHPESTGKGSFTPGTEEGTRAHTVSPYAGSSFTSREEKMETVESGDSVTIVARSAPTQRQQHRGDPSSSFRLPEILTSTSSSLQRSPLAVSMDTNDTSTSQNASDVSTQDDDSFSNAGEQFVPTNTGTTLVTVSPAPRDQRSSYALHSKSKLALSETGQTLIDTTSPGAMDSGLQDESGALRLSSTSRGEKMTGVGTSVPEAVLQPVLPAKKQRRTGASVVSNSPVLALRAEGVSQEAPPTSVMVAPPTSIQLQGAPPTKTKEAPLTSTQLQRAPPTNTHGAPPTNTHGAPPTSTQLQRAPPTPMSTQAPSIPPTQGALKDLNLPPLKGATPVREVHVDGSEMVRQLPPLKLMSPSTSSLFDSGSLSRRRTRTLPPYSIHRPPGGMALAPACPEYGVEQPIEKEVLRSIARRRSSQMEATDSGGLVASRKQSSSSEPQAALGSRQSSEGDITTTPLPTQGSQMGWSDGERQARKTSLDTSNQLQQRVLSSTVPEDLTEQLNATVRETAGPLEISQMPTGPGPLHLAAKSGNLRRLQSLIAQGHDVDMPDHEGKTPLMYCITSKGVHLSCADALIREGANLNRQSLDGSTATHMAAFVGAVSLIELMLLNGANPDIRDFDGRLPLHWGTTPRSPKCIDVLMKHSSLDINATDDAGMTPLMWAAYHNNSTVTAYLLDHGADTEEKDMDGYTAMHWAIHRGGIQCLQMLLKPDMTFFKDHKGRTIMHHAAEKGSMAACELVLKMRSDAIYDIDKMGRSPLHYAAACSRIDVCAILLDRGCDASQQDHKGHTSLDYARIKKLDYVVALLTCHGSAVADFARASRSTSVSSLLNRAVSFPQLLPTTSPLSSPSPSTFSLLGPHPPWSDAVTTTTGNTTAQREPSNLESASTVSAHSGTGTGAGVETSSGGGRVDTAVGGYLGKFTLDNRDPLRHFYFWLKPSTATICWSREPTRKTSPENESRVLEVHSAPSNALRNSTNYSTNPELYKNVFSVLTDHGMLDLLAYNEDAQQQWLKDTGQLAQRNNEEEDQRNRLLGVTGMHQSSEDVATRMDSTLLSDVSRQGVVTGATSAGESEEIVLFTRQDMPQATAWVAPQQDDDQQQRMAVEMDDSCGNETSSGSAYRSNRPQRTSLQDFFQISRRSPQVVPLTSTPGGGSMTTGAATPDASHLIGHGSLVLLDDII